jgi:hypothetical protein
VHSYVSPSQQHHHHLQPKSSSNPKQGQQQVVVLTLAPGAVHLVHAQAIHRQQQQEVVGPKANQGQEGQQEHALLQLVVSSSNHSSGQVSNIISNSSSQPEAARHKAAGQGQLPSAQQAQHTAPALEPLLSACMPVTFCCGPPERQLQGR